MLDFCKMAAILAVLSIAAPTMTALASAQEGALSEGGATWACGLFGKMPRR